MSLDERHLFLSAAADGLTAKVMRLLDVHHQLGSVERSSRLVDSVTLVCVAAASVYCTCGNRYRCYAVILVGRTALYDHRLQLRPHHLRQHHCLSQQKYRASTP